MSRSLRAHWPFAAGAALYLAAVAAALALSVRAADGRFVYALDDAYIHMAMAQNLVRHGVWGVTPADFSSASSSPLWTLLLAAAYALFGVRESAGLAFNVLFGVALLWCVARMARTAGVPTAAAAALLAALVFLTPLPTLAIEGLEHTLQILVDVAFLAHAVRLVEGGAAERRADRWACLALAPLVTSVRYEGVFLVGVVALLLAARRRLGGAALLAAAGAIPVLAYGALSIGHGWYALPNSVLLKAQSLGGLPHLTDPKAVALYGARGVRALAATPHVLVVVAAALAWTAFHLRAGGAWTAACLANVVFVCVTALHLQFAGLGWFYRYESYLVAMGLCTAVLYAPEAIRGALAPGAGARRAPLAAACAALVFVLGAPLADRAAKALKDTPAATANIYQQQYQMGLFFREFYSGEPVAANDIGAVSFLHGGPLLDLVGLATMPVAAARRARVYDAAMMTRFAEERGVRVAILYEGWFGKSGVPPGWRKAGQWTIPNRVAASHETVAIYAVAPGEDARLRESLRRFSARLPAAVVQKGAYLDGAPRAGSS